MPQNQPKNPVVRFREAIAGLYSFRKYGSGGHATVPPVVDQDPTPKDAVEAVVHQMQNRRIAVAHQIEQLEAEIEDPRKNLSE